VTQERTDEHKQLDAVKRRIHELESENKFLKSGSLLRRKPLLKDRF
jgi:cell division protein FtsB